MNNITREHLSSKKYLRLRVIDMTHVIKLGLLHSKLINQFLTGVSIQCNVMILSYPSLNNKKKCAIYAALFLYLISKVSGFIATLSPFVPIA